MVDKDVPEDRELGVEGGYLPEIRLEGGAEPAQGSGGVELGDFPFDLFREELSFEIWATKLVSTGVKQGSRARSRRADTSRGAEGRVSQCSCLPVRRRPTPLMAPSPDSACLASGAWGATLSAAALTDPSCSGGAAMAEARTVGDVELDPMVLIAWIGCF